MYQFGIRSLLILTTTVAGVVWVLFAPPQWVGVVVLFGVHLALPPVVIAGIAYHRGYRQAFFVGTAPWIAATFVGLSVFSFELLEDAEWMDVFGMRARDAVEAKLFLSTPLMVILLSGLVAMAVRWWAQKQDPPPPG